MCYFRGALLPRPPPDLLPVVLGPLDGRPPLAPFPLLLLMFHLLVHFGECASRHLLQKTWMCPPATAEQDA